MNRFGRRELVVRGGRLAGVGAALALGLATWIRETRLALAPFTSGEAMQNYADRGRANWQRAYYAENLERLVAIKRAVDPANRFRHAQSIPTRL